MKKVFFDKLLIATGNRNKYKEIKALLTPFDIEVLAAFDYDIEEPEETGSNFRENSLLKSKYYAEKLNMVSLADDSGLCVSALGGKPGIYSGRWALECGGFDEAIEKIQKLLADKRSDDYNAKFECSISIFDPFKKESYFFDGNVSGKLQFPPRGKSGFGYDPIFVPKWHKDTFAEMGKENKNEISHRAVALKKFIEWLHHFS